jgi:ElaB/YqjD/DUF883 family membrane-anchored ribosome-binding protein
MSVDISAERLIEDLRKLVTEAETLLAEGGAKVNDYLGSARGELESHLRTVKAQLERAERRASRKFRRAARVADRYAGDHPWHVGGAGVAVGLLLGIVIGLALGSGRD